jgi:DNA polymerase elongation subunit (family B)
MSKPKILNIDIETSPNVTYTWGLYNQNIGIKQIEEQGRLLCFAAKWYGDPEITFRSEFHHSKEDMLDEAWYLLDQADAVMGWNTAAFDIKHLNREFVEAGYLPPSSYQHIDLLKTVRKQFRFPSNKLDYISQKLAIGTKLDHYGFQLWIDALKGDPKAWALFKRYNKQDVVLVEEAYEILKPWIDGATLNVAHFSDDGFACPRCGGDDLTELEQVAYTKVNKFTQYRCGDCGFVARSRKADKGHTKPEVV